jgi:hypothetical protein
MVATAFKEVAALAGRLSTFLESEGYLVRGKAQTFA